MYSIKDLLPNTYYAISDLSKRTAIRLGENYVLYLSEPDPDDTNNITDTAYGYRFVFSKEPSSDLLIFEKTRNRSMVRRYEYIISGDFLIDANELYYGSLSDDAEHFNEIFSGEGEYDIVFRDDGTCSKQLAMAPEDFTYPGKYIRYGNFIFVTYESESINCPKNEIYLIHGDGIYRNVFIASRSYSKIDELIQKAAGLV